MKREDWIAKLILSSIPLRQLNHLRQPVGFASGCLIDYSGKRLVLTVAHATGNNENWGIEIKATENIGTEVYQIGAMMFLTQGNVANGEFKEVDFSYATVPSDLQPFFHELNERGQIITQLPREILRIDFNIVPNEENKFGFFGQSNFSKENWLMVSESRLVLDLKYVGMKDDFYKFKLPNKHPGHNYFRGTSGAPIIDTDGNTVALVCHGDEDEDLIFGVALSKYKSALDIEVMN